MCNSLQPENTKHVSDSDLHDWACNTAHKMCMKDFTMLLEIDSAIQRRYIILITRTAQNLFQAIMCNKAIIEISAVYNDR
jgi:hypothetical protein